MKNLDLATCGVEELDEAQMREVDGGIWGAIAAGVGIYLIISAIEYPDAFVDGLCGR